MNSPTYTTSMAYVGRFAPSPTGRMHAGNIFAYLVAWLAARQSGGKIVLRIEDLDASRSRKEFADQILFDLDLLGLTWDEGPIVQSQRTKYYEDALSALQEKAHIYPCFCTRADLHAASAPHAGETLKYSGTCRNLSKEAQLSRTKELQKQGRQPSLRIIVPDQNITFTDTFQGLTTYNLAHDCGDFVVRRSDGSFAYQLAVVVDDAYSCVTSVVRGVDLLLSTALQIYLQQLLGFPTPSYAHIPLFIAPDKHRIAKRHNDAGLDSLLATYKTPEAILGTIAYRTGLIEHNIPCSAATLVEIASLEKLNGIKEILWA